MPNYTLTNKDTDILFLRCRYLQQNRITNNYIEISLKAFRVDYRLQLLKINMATQRLVLRQNVI